MSGNSLKKRFKRLKSYVLIYTKRFIKYHFGQYRFTWSKWKKSNSVLKQVMYIDFPRGSILLK